MDLRGAVREQNGVFLLDFTPPMGEIIKKVGLKFLAKCRNLMPTGVHVENG
jgi:hypothetical protein